MRNVLKWVGIVLGVVVLILLIGVGAIFAMGSNKWTRSYPVDTPGVAIPTDEAAIARGQHIVEARGACVGCHGENLGGDVFMEDASFATIYAPNLTGGQGGVGTTNTDADWVKAIRYGVGHDGRGMFGMPSYYYTYLSDEDLGALIAYLKTVPPVDNQVPKRSAAFLPKMLLGVGALPLAPDQIDANVDRNAPPAGVTAAYGEYLVNTGVCRECHGANLAGVTDPNGPPPGPNLTPGGELQGWTYADFQRALREGVTPSGHEFSDEMPWKEFGQMTDEELQAIWTYLQGLPARELGDNG